MEGAQGVVLIVGVAHCEGWKRSHEAFCRSDGSRSLARQAVWREGGAARRISHYYATHYHITSFCWRERRFSARLWHGCGVSAIERLLSLRSLSCEARFPRVMDELVAMGKKDLP